ncbi:MAG: futalosine hydrolase [Nitrospirae bacterium]|nr:futalosine hydrolase [Nitrospirota bacterium]
MEFLAILTSVPFESEIILSQLKNVRKTEIAGKTAYKGKLSNINILLMNTGIGDVNAAHSATGIIEHFPIRYIINFGVGGAYPHARLEIGHIAIALKEIYSDKGVISSKGQKGLKEIGIPLVQAGRRKYFNEFPFDKNLVQKVLKRITHYASHPSPIPLPQGEGVRGRVKAGNFITVSSATGTYNRAIELEKKFNAICENMEGAAIAQVCAIYKIPMLEIRGISNIVGERDKRKWDLKLASENCQRVVLRVISSLLPADF